MCSVSDTYAPTYLLTTYLPLQGVAVGPPTYLLLTLAGSGRGPSFLLTTYLPLQGVAVGPLALFASDSGGAYEEVSGNY